MDELLKAIEELNRVYKASGVGSVFVELGHGIRIEIDGIAKGLPYKNTNGKWLRGLSDEEFVRCLYGKYDKSAQDYMLDWLRAEHKEAE